MNIKFLDCTTGKERIGPLADFPELHICHISDLKEKGYCEIGLYHYSLVAEAN